MSIKRFDAKKLDPFTPPGTKFLCSFGFEIPRVPYKRCSPKEKFDDYAMCSPCKDFQRAFPRIPWTRLAEEFRRIYGPD